MRHTRKDVIERTIREFECLDELVRDLADEDWNRLLPRPETKDPWTVKDALAHITHWKADEIRRIKRRPVPAEEKGLNWTDGNRLIYERWRDRSPQEVLAWHRQVQADVLAALREASEGWFTGRERRPDWPYNLDDHSSLHRVKDIEQALKTPKRNKRMQFWGKDEHDDSLIIEILNGLKTATVSSADKYDEPGGEYDDGGWETGDIVDVYDLKGGWRCRVRITDVYPVTFGNVPERLWKGEACKSKKHFQDVHRECWPEYQLDDDFPLIATHFELVR